MYHFTWAYFNWITAQQKTDRIIFWSECLIVAAVAVYVGYFMATGNIGGLYVG